MEDNATIVRSLFEAFNEDRLDDAVGLAADDFELDDPALGLTLHGPDGLREWLTLFKTALPDARTELVTLLAEGDLAASEHVGRGTNTGPLRTPTGTVPPTGRTVELRIAELYRLREGKLVSLTAYYDSAALLRQLGLLPPAGSLPERMMIGLASLRIRARNLIRRRR